MKVKLFFLFGLSVAVLVTALAVVVARHNARVQHQVLQVLQSERDDYEVEWGRLQLELSSQATHGRIARMAEKNLQMEIPHSGETVLVVRRVVR